MRGEGLYTHMEVLKVYEQDICSVACGGNSRLANRTDNYNSWLDEEQLSS